MAAAVIGAKRGTSKSKHGVKHGQPKAFIRPIHRVSWKSKNLESVIDVKTAVINSF
jgi:hypothetical protein